MLCHIGCNRMAFRRYESGDEKLNAPLIWSPLGTDRSEMGVLLSHPYCDYVDGRANSLSKGMTFRMFRKRMDALQYGTGWNEGKMTKLISKYLNYFGNFFEIVWNLMWLTSDSFRENDLLHTVQINGLSGEWCFRWLFKCSFRVNAWKFRIQNRIQNNHWYLERST